MHQSLSQIIAREMPDTLVLPTFGNNDFDIDDEPANETTKKDFYNRIYKMWFEEHPTNAKKIAGSNMSAVNHHTFHKGGYYRVDITPKLSVLALNTVMYLFKNQGFHEQGTQQTD